MRSVVVTGVGGSLGQRVARLLAEHHDVDRIVGIDMVAPAFSHPKLEFRMVDLSVPGGADGQLRESFRGVDGILHLAWRTPDERGRPSDVAEAAVANRTSLSRVLQAAAEADVVSVVFVSSATVYGAWPDNKVPLTEDTPLRPNPEFGFAVAKAEAERVAADWAAAHAAVDMVVLRPAVTLGSPGRPLYQALGATRTPRSADSSRPVQYLHVDDLAAAVVVAWERHLRGVFNVAPDAGVPEDQARALAGGVAKLTLPSRVAQEVSDLAWRFWRSGVPKEARAYAIHPWVVAPDKLKAEGWAPAYSSEEALVATDARPHWDDLPPGKRQNYNLIVAVIAVAGVVAGAGALVAAIRSRRRRRNRA
ncbi:MAG TPA: NAD-dependent epimerase/dehydratase family protein [Acidimicrobiales bacterium]